MADDDPGRRRRRVSGLVIGTTLTLALTGVGVGKWLRDRDTPPPVVTISLNDTGGAYSGVAAGTGLAGTPGAVAGWRRAAQPTMAALRLASGRLWGDLMDDDVVAGAADVAVLRQALSAAQALPPIPDGLAASVLGDSYYNYDRGIGDVVEELGMRDPVQLDAAMQELQQADHRADQVDVRVTAVAGPAV